jgi:hypothetical protein
LEKKTAQMANTILMAFSHPLYVTYAFLLLAHL